MELFHVIEGGHAILLCNGIYKQTKIYRRGNKVFASHAGGFVELLGVRGTSNPNVRWIDAEGEGVSVINPDRYGGHVAWAAPEEPTVMAGAGKGKTKQF